MAGFTVPSRPSAGSFSSVRKSELVESKWLVAEVAISSGGGGGTAIYGLYRYVPLFSDSLLYDRVYKSERLGLE